MAIPNVTPNLQFPLVSGTIDRPRLLEKMSAVLEHRLTLITAPPGYGKTTLAAQFAQQLRQPVAWHTIEERERDVPGLHQQCALALRVIAPDLDTEAAQQGSAPAELATAITTQLREKIREHAVFFLDDAQNLASSPAAESWLRTFVAYLPPKCHLVLIGRIIPDLPLTEMIARREVFGIGQKELLFTESEIDLLARKIGKQADAGNEGDRVARSLEGWPAGVVLALQPLPRDVEDSILSGKISRPEDLFNSLAGAMLRAQPSPLRNFLLRSSTLSRLTPELCQKILGIKNSHYWLDEIHARGLFVSKAQGGLAYHSLFRSFLQHELETTDPALFTRLHLDAARWFEIDNLFDDAIEHYLIAEYADRAAILAERLAHAYHSQGHLETLLNWGRQLQRLHAEAPRLYYTCAMLYTDRYEYDHALESLELAEIGFRQRQDAVGLTSTAIQRAMIHMVKGEYHEAAARAVQIIQHSDLASTLLSRTLSILGYSYLRLGKVEAAVNYLEETLPLYRADGNAYALSQALQDLSVAYMQLGRLDDAGACLQEVVALSRSLNSASALALALNNLGYYYHLRSDYGQALSTFQDGLSVATRILDRRAESYLLWSLGDLQRDRGAFDYAIKLYEKGLELNGAGEPVVRSALLLSHSTLKRWQHEFDEALALAEDASTVASEYNIAIDQTMAKILIWAVQAQRGRALEALDYFAQAERELNEQGARVELLRLLAIQAHTCLLCADPDGARQHLKTAIALAEQTGSYQPFAAEAAHNPLLRSFVAMHSIAQNKTFARDLRALEQSQTATARQSYTNRRASGSTTYAITVTTLGREDIERDGTLITASHWRANAARELFLHLLFNGPQSRDDLCLAFWPDSPSKQVRSLFHTTLHRARKALGDNVLIHRDGLYMIDPELDLRCDAHQMRDCVRQARLLSRTDAHTEDLWFRAAQLYQGEFLRSVGAVWALPLRESLREMYLEALVGLAECSRARGELNRAVEVLQTALAVDPLREDIHRLIMTCYAQRGEKNKVMTQLNNLREILWNELELEPSAETTRHAQDLLR